MISQKSEMGLMLLNIFDNVYKYGADSYQFKTHKGNGYMVVNKRQATVAVIIKEFFYAVFFYCLHKRKSFSIDPPIHTQRSKIRQRIDYT